MIGATLVGGLAQASSANKAAKAQQSAAADQLALQERVYTDTVDRLSPYADPTFQNVLRYELLGGAAPMVGGTAPAITEITDNVAASGPGRWNERQQQMVYDTPATSRTRYSVNGQMFDTRDAAQTYADANQTGGTAYGGFTATPSYGFRLNEGMKAMQTAAGQGSGLVSSGALRRATQFGQDLASTEYDNYLNRITGAAGSAQNAAAQQGAAAQFYANGAGDAMASRGNAQAAGAIGVGNAFSSGLNNMAGVIGYQRAQTGTQPQNWWQW